MNRLIAPLFALALIAIPLESVSFAQTYYRSYSPSRGRVVYRSYRPTTYRQTQPSTTRRYPSSTRSIRYPLSSRGTSSRGAAYRLDEGDILAVIIDGVLGDFGSAPVHLPKEGSGLLPGMGYPVPIRARGLMPLPLIDDVNVRGMTVTQAEKAIARAYRSADILKKENRVSVSLLRKRTVRVTVVHDDPIAAARTRGYSSFYSQPRKMISTVDLPADRTNVLNALAESGGRLPRDSDIRILNNQGTQAAGPGSALRDGDVVGVESPEQAFFFTSGLLPGGQFPLPSDRPLTVQQAVAVSGGSAGNIRAGSFGPSELIVVRARGGAFRVGDPSRTIVRPGDTITLRYTPGEAAGNIATQAIQGIRIP